MRGVVTCPEHLAAFAGAEILAAGGNATDAAIATAFAQGVVGPKLSGIGGVGVMTAFNASTRSTECIRFWGTAGSKARPDLFAGDLAQVGENLPVTVRGYRNAVGYLSVLVPGFVRGMHDAFLRHGSGRVSWSHLIAPAIRLAAKGFQVDDYLYRFWRSDTPVDDICPPYTTLTATPACAAIYTRNGDVYHPGEHLVQADYARTLQCIAEEGAAVFYEGSIGAQIAADIEDHSGLFTKNDLVRYCPLISEPLRGTYRGYEIVSDPPPGSGALVIEILNILEGVDLGVLGWNTPKYFDILARVFKHVFKGRSRYMADPRFVDVPVGMLTSKSYADEFRDRLRTMPLDVSRGSALGHEGTTHVSAMDAEGNAAAITHTVCDASGVVTPGLGFMLNNDMSAFDPRPGHRNSIAPGKSPVNGGAPTIVLKDGQAVLAIGSPAGPRKVTAVVQALLNIVDFGMSIEQALAADRIHQEVGPLTVDPMFPPELARALEALGHRLEVSGYTARVAAVYRDPGTKQLAGATDRWGGNGKATVE